MSDILTVKNLCKAFPEFSLKDVSFSLPYGCVMGFIGENGAGKSTTIRLILNLLQKDAGHIEIFGRQMAHGDKELKNSIGVVFDDCRYFEQFKTREVNRILKGLYTNWSESTFTQYLERFELSKTKLIKDYSRGMKMKLMIAIALSHDAKLLILDEATSGLDPIVRDEILDIFLDYISGGDRSVFISSHIISDLEKACDYITFIHKGQVAFSEPKDTLLDDYRVLKCSNAQFEAIDRTGIIGYRKNQFGVDALVKADRGYGELLLERPSIEDIMLFYVRGEKR